MARMSVFLKQYSKPAPRSGYQSGVMAFLSFIYGFNRKGKRISLHEKEKMEISDDQYFLKDRNFLV
jgi:hypothetical protein